MSPLRSSPVYISLSPDSAHSSSMPYSIYCKSDSSLSTDEYAEPQSKKRKLQTKKPHLSEPSSDIYIASSPNCSHASDKECKFKATASPDLNEVEQAKHSTTKPQSKKHPGLSQDQIDAIKAASIPVEEFTELYKNVPKKFRTGQFYKTCRAYVCNIFKTKQTEDDKKKLFLLLPQKLKMSLSLFKLIFKQEAELLSDIRHGRTDVNKLQESLNKLLPFFQPSYLQKQIYQYSKHKKSLLEEEHYIISTCRKNLGKLDKQILSEPTHFPDNQKTIEPIPIREHVNVLDERQQPVQSKYKQELHPTAKKILESLKNATINTSDIVSARKQLICLNVDKYLINLEFRKFRTLICMSSRPDKQDVLQAINESGKHTATIKSKTKLLSNTLRPLLNQALKGAIPLTMIQSLRTLLLNELDKSKAYSYLYKVKKALIKHNKDQEQDIKKTFKRAFTRPLRISCKFRDLEIKIKAGNLSIQEFTRLYDSIPMVERTATLSKMSAKYINDLSSKMTNFEDRIQLLTSLPKYLQKSHAIIKILFPNERHIMSSIRNGSIKSSDMLKHIPSLLRIITPKYLLSTIDIYVRINTKLSFEDNKNIAECRATIRQFSKTLRAKLSKKLHQQKQDTLLHPEAKLILQSINNCTINAKDIVEAREKLLLLGVERKLVKNTFKDLEKHILQSNRPDIKDVLQEIELSSKKVLSIRSATKHAPQARLDSLLDAASKCTLDIRDIGELRTLLFETHEGSRASSLIKRIKIKLIKARPKEKQKIMQAFKEAHSIKPQASAQSIALQNALKKDNLHVTEFTALYDAILTLPERWSIQKKATRYVNNLTNPTMGFSEKIAIIALLPKNLRMSTGTLNSFFPEESKIILSIRNGTLSSTELMKSCKTILQITTITYIRRMLYAYIRNKPSMSDTEKMHIDECRKMLSELKQCSPSKSIGDITSRHNSEDEDASTTSHNQTDTSVEDKTATTQANNKHISPVQEASTSIKYNIHPCPNPNSTWYTSIQQIPHETQSDLLYEPIISTIQQTSPTVTESYMRKPYLENTQASRIISTELPQPSTSHSIEYSYETAPSFSLEQISLEDINCVLQSACTDTADNQDLQQFLTQLSQELPHIEGDVEQIISHTAEKSHMFQSNIQENNIQDNNIDKPMPDNEEMPTVSEYLLDITTIAEDLNPEDIDQLADIIEVTIPTQDMNPEDFFDFSNIDD